MFIFYERIATAAHDVEIQTDWPSLYEALHRWYDFWFWG